jgi:signal transduction histidine kinase
VRARRATPLAAVLVAIATVLPTAAWYVVGSREVARRAAEIVAEAGQRLAREIETTATALATRLERVRETEARRPFYHYQSVYHDPEGAAQGLAVTTSPLAGGPTDPLVLSHFQIDAEGRVTVPSVNDRFPELSARDGLAAYCDFLSAMHDAVVLDVDAPPVRDEERVLVLDRAAWQQNLLAESVYGMLTGQEPAHSHDGSAVQGPGRVVVRVGPMRWRTLVVGRGTLLAAMREVATPAGTLVQGFAVSPSDVVATLGERSPKARFEPVGNPHGGEGLSARVGDTGWQLWLPEGAPSALAARAAAAIRSDFIRTFAAGAFAILLAGAAVVLLVARSEGLARQRAAFAAAAAHELKTPIAGLRLYSEMLADGLGRPDEAAEYARHVAEESARLGRVVTNMLDLARLERGAQLVHPRAGDLTPVVATAVDRLRPALADAGLQIACALPDDLPAGQFDPDATTQIVANLLDNAETHTRGCTSRVVEVTLGQCAEHLVLTVADNGPGLPSNLRRRLFRPFQRGTAETSGLGIGLALARSLARAQGGDLVAEDRQQGAAFTLTIPLVRARMSTPQPAAQATSGGP